MILLGLVILSMVWTFETSAVCSFNPYDNAEIQTFLEIGIFVLTHLGTKSILKRHRVIGDIGTRLTKQR